MNELIKNILKQFADALIFGNFFIAFCAAALVHESYLLLGHEMVFDGLTFFVFFSTLALYNFHRLLGVRRIKPEDQGIITGWAAKHQFTLLMLVIIGIGGAGFFAFQLYSQSAIFFTLIPLAVISLFYELPIVKFQKRFQRLRNLWLSKAILITLVWAVTTSLLPALNVKYSLTDYHVWLTVIERMIFILILALCFDARDVEFDKKDSVRTIPIVFGMERTKELYKIFSIAFFILTILHYVILDQAWGIAVAMSLSGGITYYVVSNTTPRRSDYYYMYWADGMMFLQFLLTWILTRIG